MNTNALIRRLSLALLIGLVAASRFAIAASDNGTLTVGEEAIPCGVTHWFVNGFISGSIGSYTPTGLTGGDTVSEVFDQFAFPGCVGSHSALEVSGFSSDPGSSWLTSITCNAVKNNGSGVTSYTYSGGHAVWIWSTLFGLLGKNGTNVSCTIVHN
jgi:hypothetical protein